MQREGEEKIYFNLSPKGEMRMITPLFNFPSEDNQYTIISNYNLLVHTLPKLIAEDHMTCIPHYMYENTQHNINTYFSMFTVTSQSKTGLTCFPALSIVLQPSRSTLSLNTDRVVFRVETNHPGSVTHSDDLFEH